MSDTPDAETAWEEWRKENSEWVGPHAVILPRRAFLAGYSARLDALHAENRAREQWWNDDGTAPKFRVADVSGMRNDDDYRASIAAVPDREGATEQLAALLLQHQPFRIPATGTECTRCDDYPWESDEDDAAHVAAVIVAAGWHRMHDLDGVLRELNIHIEEGTE